jgi:hypothetical protein
MYKTWKSTYNLTDEESLLNVLDVASVFPKNLIENTTETGIAPSVGVVYPIN